MFDEYLLGVSDSSVNALPYASSVRRHRGMLPHNWVSSRNEFIMYSSSTVRSRQCGKLLTMWATLVQTLLNKSSPVTK